MITALLIFLSIIPSFTRLSIEEGLSNPTVNDIFIDGKGVVWIGTKDGLDSYDGSSIKVFLPNSGDENSEVGNAVGKIEGGKDGRMFLVLPNHLGIFDERNSSFRNIPCKSISSLAYQDELFVAGYNSIYRFKEETEEFEEYVSLKNNLSISSIACLGDTLWIGTKQDGLYISVGGTSPEKRIDAGKVADIYRDSKGNTWISTWTNGLYKIGKDWTITNYRCGKTGGVGLSSNFVRSCCEDEVGNVFIGTIKGLDVLDVSTGQIRHVSNGADAQGSLSSDSIWKIRRDRQGNLWIATYYGGVNYFYPGKGLFTFYGEAKNNSDGLSNPIVGRMYGDGKDNLWIATEAGVSYLDRQSGKFRYFGVQSDAGQTLEHVKALYPDEKNKIIWAGADMGGLYKIETVSGKIKAFYNMIMMSFPSMSLSTSSSAPRTFLPFEASNFWIRTMT